MSGVVITPKSIVIEVPNPTPIDNGPIDKIFGSHQAIAEAEGLFWNMKLAHQAELGTVTKTETGYAIEFKYKEVKFDNH
jgi:hypothetical protein